MTAQRLPPADDPGAGQPGSAVFSWRDDYLATGWLSSYSQIQEHGTERAVGDSGR